MHYIELHNNETVVRKIYFNYLPLSCEQEKNITKCSIKKKKKKKKKRKATSILK